MKFFTIVALLGLSALPAVAQHDQYHLQDQTPGGVEAGIVIGDAVYVARGRATGLDPDGLPADIKRGEYFQLKATVSGAMLRSSCAVTNKCYVTADLKSVRGELLLEHLESRWGMVRSPSGSCSFPVRVTLWGTFPGKGSTHVTKGAATLVVRLFILKDAPSLLDYDIELARLEMPVVIH